jgi:hypothetical protein
MKIPDVLRLSIPAHDWPLIPSGRDIGFLSGARMKN